MQQDPFQRVKTLLFESRVDPLALLLDLMTLLPEYLLRRALWLRVKASEAELPASRTVSLPEAREAKQLMPLLSELQRYEILERLIIAAEDTLEDAIGAKNIDRSTEIKTTHGDPIKLPNSPIFIAPAPSLPAVEPGGIAAIGPPDNTGGGFESAGGGFGMVGDDEGFEAVPSAPPPVTQPAMPTATEPPAAPRDIVNLGFSHKDAADKTMQSDEPLQPAQSYYFWLNIGYEHKDSIGAPTRIDLEKLPEEAVLTVAVFAFQNELAITPGQDVGELKIQRDGSVKVQRQPGEENTIPLSAGAPNGYLKDFLLFPISVPDKEGTYRLRCNIYCAQVLVQSHVISAHVKSTTARVPESYAKKLDYVLSQTLRASHLASITKEPHLLSLMINDNGDGSHSFRFFGTDGTERFKDDAQMDGPQLSGFLKQARSAMHRVSWGSDDEWNPNGTLSYRYQSPNFDRKKLARDLAYLARAGWRIYSGFLNHLSTTRAALEAIMANSGLVQIALKMSPRAVLPAAIVYDYEWKPTNFDFPNTDFDLCSTFSKAIDDARAGGPPLEECVCFNGGCALKAMIDDILKPGSTKTMLDLKPIICPSGFWGYRHLLGLPLTLDGANMDVPPVIEFDDELQMIACVSTDPLFVERDPHLTRLKALKTGLKFERDEGYGPFFSRLKSTVPHLLYFYCHGGIKADSNNPYLEVGKKDQIEPPDWMGERILWKGPNPLVFINGCHTTSLNPEVTLDFVSSFVQQSGAAGVIGTEITIFEPLAAKFAEECLSRFVGAPPHNESMPIGKAVRGARLELLKQGNPLGLVYIPYAVASLRLQEKQ